MKEFELVRFFLLYLFKINFIESACWPDDLKEFSLHAMDNWHYTTIPINMENINTNKNISLNNSNDAFGIIVNFFKKFLILFF